ncbi:MAG TPA: PfkB family carbohydrate kinase [Streptosporangiaceae bacterium]|jgi:fructokinase
MITVLGEAFIALVPTSDETVVRALPEGSALTIAVSASGLGYPTALMARLSRDPFGRLLRRHAVRNGVDLSAAPDAEEPSTIAVVAHGASEDSRASLYLSGTADWQWSSAELAWIPSATTVLHVGSLVCCVAPGATHVLRAVARLRKGGAVVCLGLNARPDVMGTPGRGRLLMERPIRSATVIRASLADIAWLYPGRAPEAVAEDWLALGPDLVVITCGPRSVMAVRGSGSVLHRPAYPVDAADTAGAADAFTAALVGGLHQLRHAGADVGSLPGRDLAELIDTASLVAGMTCERAGASPPTAAELRQRRQSHSWPAIPVPAAGNRVHAGAGGSQWLGSAVGVQPGAGDHALPGAALRDAGL